jgi:hypothetical protein
MCVSNKDSNFDMKESLLKINRGNNKQDSCTQG